MFKLVGLVAVAALIGGCDATSAGPPTTSSTAEVAPPLDPAPPMPALAGTYANDYYGPARVTNADGELTLALGPRDVFPLTHWDGNVFTFVPTGESAYPGTISKATFDVAKLTLEFYDEEKLGTFARAGQ